MEVRELVLDHAISDGKTRISNEQHFRTALPQLFRHLPHADEKMTKKSRKKSTASATSQEGAAQADPNSLEQGLHELETVSPKSFVS